MNRHQSIYKKYFHLKFQSKQLEEWSRFFCKLTGTRKQEIVTKCKRPKVVQHATQKKLQILKKKKGYQGYRAQTVD